MEKKPKNWKLTLDLLSSASKRQVSHLTLWTPPANPAMCEVSRHSANLETLANIPGTLICEIAAASGAGWILVLLEQVRPGLDLGGQVLCPAGAVRLQVTVCWPPTRKIPAQLLSHDSNRDKPPWSRDVCSLLASTWDAVKSAQRME